MLTNRRGVVGIIIIVALIAAVGLFQSPIQAQMMRWDLLPKPEDITELYFTEPNRLPATYTPGQPLNFTFTLHNDTGSTQTYRYTLSSQSDSSAALNSIQVASITLPTGETRAITITFTPSDLGARAKFDIGLTNSQQHINFWVTRS